jgi:hypothetical protein
VLNSIFFFIFPYHWFRQRGLCTQWFIITGVWRKKDRSHFVISFRYLLSYFAAYITGGSVYLLLGFLFCLGTGCYCRLAIILYHGCTECTGRKQGQFVNDCELYRFSITIISIQLINQISNDNNRFVYLLLAIGPILGLAGLLT